MNEKFKKDEVWGYLGKTKDKTVGIQDYASGQILGNREGHGLIPNPNVRLATIFDVFFFFFFFFFDTNKTTEVMCGYHCLVHSIFNT